MTSPRKAYFVGGGIGSLAGAAFLGRNGGMPGGQISILEASALTGGSLDGAGDAARGHSMRGGRMLSTDNDECTWDLFKSIPSLVHPGLGVFEETLEFNERHVSNARARLVDSRRAKVPVASMGLSMHDWLEVSSTETLAGVKRTVLNRHDSLVVPLQRWLQEQGVRLVTDCVVTDLDHKTVKAGGVMVGGTVSRVEVSRHGDFKVGERVLGDSGWQDYALSDGTGLTSPDPEDPHPSRALGVLGMPGFTAHMGLLDIDRPVPGETVVVAAACGAVGSVVGQIARIKGCAGVGIAGGAQTCRDVTEELGFGTCVDRHADELPGRVAAACAKGIRVYFESVGGACLRRRAAAAQRQGARARVRPDRRTQRHSVAAGPGPAGPDGRDAAARRGSTVGQGTRPTARH